MAEYNTPVSTQASPTGTPPAAPLTDPNAPDPLQEYQTVEYWAKEFAAAKKWMSRFVTRAEKAEKAYLVEAGTNDHDRDSRFNLFWSNVQTQLSAYYAKIPQVEVDRKHHDPKDDAARVASIILQRIFNLEAQMSTDDSPHEVYREVIKDRLVAGMGIAWARYDFTTAPVELTPGVPAFEAMTDEMAPLDYVRWEDFMFSPCRRWEDKRWVARRMRYSKQQATERFTPEVADRLTYSTKSPKSAEDVPEAETAEIWEIWCHATKSAHFYSVGYEQLLDTKPDPLSLSNFWPCRKPLIATHTSKAFLPRPDYFYTKSQYEELNLIAMRTYLLTEALKVVGVYDKQSGEVQRMLNQADQNDLIPVDNWAMFAEKGGIKGVVDWMPLDVVAQALERLSARKMELSTEIFEILGISDIQRGMSASRNETATTQRLKAQFGSARSDNVQRDIAQFITDNTRTRAEIICRKWKPETIMERSQIEQTQEPQELIMAAVQFLKSASPVQLVSRLNVHSDTIAAPDWDLEKQQRVDFLQAISQFMGMAEPMLDKEPMLAPYMVQIIQWTASGFKAAKTLEGVFDQMLSAIQQDIKMKMGKPKPPSPAEEKDKATAIKTYQDAKKSMVEAATLLTQLGMDPQMIEVINPTPPPPPGAMPPVGPPGLPQPPNAGGGLGNVTKMPPRVPVPAPSGPPQRKPS